MGRKILAVIVGFVVWSVLWVGGNAVLLAEQSKAMAESKPVSDVGPLLIALALSVVCSLLSGLTTGAIAKGGKAALVLSVLLLLVGIAVQGSAWSLMPAWYHASFLVLLVPVTLIGGRLASSSR